jgi:glycosyltransferase involved in cell wall biosynthesis
VPNCFPSCPTSDTLDPETWRLKVSIIIPAFNEERLLAETLRQVTAAIAAFGNREWETELIVCDNNSTDRTAEVARAAGATVVFEPINQIARARNTGAAAARGDWLLFIDADSHPSLELFAEVAHQIVSGTCLAGGATVKLEAGYPWGARVVGFWNWLSRRLRWVAGSFIFCEAAAFRQIGGFNQELYASEELDLSRRLKRLARDKGKQIVILHRFPLLTSARKMHLYSPSEHLWFLAKTVLAGGRTLRSREACHTWYDGRR